MKKFILPFLTSIALIGCSPGDSTSDTIGNSQQEHSTIQGVNMLSSMSSSQMSGFQWMNEPEHFTISNGTLIIQAEKETDFFNNPEDLSITKSAPVLYKEVTGDFIATTRVRPDFSSQWNAASLMVYVDSLNWIKFAFENSDATGKTIVSVVTRSTSDDANGVILENRENIWLKIIRKGHIYSMHWSLDGVKFHMARLSLLPGGETVRIGMEAQCPVGNSASHGFEFFSLEFRTVEDLRSGE